MMNQFIQLKQISTFDAKTHLSSMLAKTENGESFIITKRGMPIAKIIPFKEEKQGVDFSELSNSLKKLRMSVKGKIDILQMKELGRNR
jgi:prevent-host-death family protein